MSKNKITILIVDDTVYNLKILSIMLSNQGYVVLEATDGVKAIELAIANTPDLILLDIKMPSMDGYQVCTNLKSNPITQQIPVIFISAIENIEEKIEAFTVGGIDFINKPFHLVEVLARVETHLRISSLQAQLLEQTKLLESRNMSLQREISNLTGFNWELYEELKQAIEESQLQLFYQPIVNFESNLITGFEALIRWEHPQKGFLNPSDFIDFVEATDLIYPIGRWVIETACQQLKIWQQLSPKYLDLTMNVNVSTKQLADFKFLQYIREIVQDSQINPHCLKLEITESTVMGDLDRTLKILHQLKDLDVQFCIDDFGTGYSSLRRLTDFPIDILKIDRSFIVNEEWVIVKAIGTLAFTLGKSVVVEGIETSLELETLKSLFSSYLNISYGQGYLFAKPLDCQAASELLLSKAEQPEYNYTNNC
ncbi:two-component system response regulator [Pseudanabaena mucicola]|uniref:EAL domain-containing protein n=1 Tax=Pseudanabaena mucicola FACHB-723 TaxID=2692860 RepID=A0ABR7ZY46_9CYAN|nr:EAL domain-containing protein [Pseudanabaena mucicola]MBD2188699.1 EAL domain-containing protein [Pseudanabaena mucicola FACHB-723]